MTSPYLTFFREEGSPYLDSCLWDIVCVSVCVCVCVCVWWGGGGGLQLNGDIEHDGKYFMMPLKEVLLLLLLLLRRP